MNNVTNAIRALYDTGRYADMKIRCEGKVFNVHRAVVCMQSPVFAGAMDNDSWKEAANGEYHLGDDELPIVEAMIHYLYHGTYDDQVALGDVPSKDVLQVETENVVFPPSSSTRPSTLGSDVSRFVQNSPPEVRAPNSNPSSLLFNANVYIIADTYMIPALKNLANEKFSRGLEAHWNTPEFSQAVELLWGNTMESDKQLRDAMVTAAATHSDGLLDRGEFVEFMSANGDFAVKVMKRARNLPEMRTWQARMNLQKKMGRPL